MNTTLDLKAARNEYPLVIIQIIDERKKQFDQNIIQHIRWQSFITSHLYTVWTIACPSPLEWCRTKTSTCMNHVTQAHHGSHKFSDKNNIDLPLLITLPRNSRCSKWKPRRRSLRSLNGIDILSYEYTSQLWSIPRKNPLSAWSSGQ